MREKSKFRSGRVTQEAYDRYVVYKSALTTLFTNDNQKNIETTTSPGIGIGSYSDDKYELLELKERQGFGNAVRHAMFHHVLTPMVMVVQHDRSLMRHVNVHDIISTMQKHRNEIGYVLLPIKSTDSYAQQWSTKLGQCGFKGKESDIRKYAIHMEKKGVPSESEQQQQQFLLPCLQWYDSTHFAWSDFYREVVFSKKLKLVSRGGFIEDKLGQEQRKTYMKEGIQRSIEFWKLWLYQDNEPKVEKMVAHLDGSSGGYSTEAMLAFRKEREEKLEEKQKGSETVVVVKELVMEEGVMEQEVMEQGGEGEKEKETVVAKEPPVEEPSVEESAATPEEKIFIRACSEGQLETAKNILLGKKININSFTSSGGTAVMFAAQNGHVDVLNFLFENGGNFLVSDYGGSTPFLEAARGGKLNVLIYLSNLGKEICDISMIDSQGWTALHAAACYGYLDCVKCLVERHFPMDKKDVDGKTPLDWAKDCEEVEVVNYLESLL